MKSIEFDLSLPKIPSFLKKIDIYHVILISAILRFFCMSFPNNGGVIYDEKFYTDAVRVILGGGYGNPEHPPLSKLLVTGFVLIFGDHWFAWRFPMVICSLVSTYLVYLIAKEFMSEKLALLGASFLIFDIVWFINGNIFLLEPLAMTLGLGCLFFYLKDRYKWSATLFSLACLASEKALLFVFALGMYHIWTNIRKVRETITSKRMIKRGLVLVAIVAMVGGGTLWVVDATLKPIIANNININVHSTIFEEEGVAVSTVTEIKTITEHVYAKNPIKHVMFMWDYYDRVAQVVNVTKEGYRPPWSWVIPFGNDPFDHGVYYADIAMAGDKRFYLIEYRAQTPLPIWYMTIPIIALAIYNYKEKQSKFILSWIGMTFVPFILKAAQYSKSTWNKNFIVTLPIICIAIPWFWNKTGGKYKYPIMVAHLAITIGFFFYFFPVSVYRPAWVVL